MFQLRMVEGVPGGRLHAISAYAAYQRGYGAFPVSCGRWVKVTMRRYGKPNQGGFAGEPYNSKDPRLCKACLRQESVAHKEVGG